MRAMLVPLSRNKKQQLSTLQQMTSTSFLKRSNLIHLSKIENDPQIANDCIEIYRFCGVQIQHLLAALHLLSCKVFDWDILWME